MVTENVDLLDRSRRLKRFLIAGVSAVVVGIASALAAYNLVETTDANGVTSTADMRFVGFIGAVAFVIVYVGLTWFLKRSADRADRATATVVKE